MSWDHKSSLEWLKFGCQGFQFRSDPEKRYLGLLEMFIAGTGI